MARKGTVVKRDVLPDPIYNSKLVTRAIISPIITQVNTIKGLIVIKTPNDVATPFPPLKLKNIGQL